MMRNGAVTKTRGFHERMTEVLRDVRWGYRDGVYAGAFFSIVLLAAMMILSAVLFCLGLFEEMVSWFWALEISAAMVVGFLLLTASLLDRKDFKEYMRKPWSEPKTGLVRILATVFICVVCLAGAIVFWFSWTLHVMLGMVGLAEMVVIKFVILAAIGIVVYFTWKPGHELGVSW